MELVRQISDLHSQEHVSSIFQFLSLLFFVAIYNKQICKISSKTRISQCGTICNPQILFDTNDKSNSISPHSKTHYFLQIARYTHNRLNSNFRNSLPLRRKMALQKNVFRTICTFFGYGSFEPVIFFYAFPSTISSLFGFQLVFPPILLFEAHDFCNEPIEALSFFRNQDKNTYDKDLAFITKRKTLLRLGGAGVEAASSKAQKGFVDYYRLSCIKTKTALLDNAASTRDIIAQRSYFCDSQRFRDLTNIKPELITNGFAK